MRPNFNFSIKILQLLQIAHCVPHSSCWKKQNNPNCPNARGTQDHSYSFPYSVDGTFPSDNLGQISGSPEQQSLMQQTSSVTKLIFHLLLFIFIKEDIPTYLDSRTSEFFFNLHVYNIPSTTVPGCCLHWS